MADDPVTPAPEPTLGNDPAARTPEGTIKDPQTPTPEPAKQPEPAKAAEPGKEPAKPDDAPVVPDKYEFKAPEGYEVDQKFLDDATPVLKELGLTQEQANKLFDIQADPEELKDLFLTKKEVGSVLLDHLKQKLAEVNQPYVR